MCHPQRRGAGCCSLAEPATVLLAVWARTSRSVRHVETFPTSGSTMHRAVSMRLGTLPRRQRLLLRSLPSHGSVGEMSASAVRLSTSRSLLSPRPRLAVAGTSSTVRVLLCPNTRGICSTAPVLKGRRGGASALMQKKSGPLRRKVPGAGKKKKPKVGNREGITVD